MPFCSVRWSISSVCAEGWICSGLPEQSQSLISVVTIAKAIRNIGATPAAILGALEPLTALFVGVMVFHERLTGGNVVGILLILFAVTLIVVGPRGWLRFKAVWHKRTVG